MSDSEPDEDYKIDFAECAGCGHVLGQHEWREAGIAPACFAALGVDGSGATIFCACPEFVAKEVAR